MTILDRHQTQYRVPTGYQAPSVAILNPNDGVAYVARNRQADANSTAGWDYKVPSQSYAYLPGPYQTAGVYYLDQSGSGRSGEITVYDTYDKYAIPHFNAIGRAVLAAGTVMDITEGTQPQNPGIGVCRLWADNQGNLYHLHSDGSTPELWDTRLAFGGSLTGTVPNPGLNYADTGAWLPDKTWFIGGPQVAGGAAQRNMLRKTEYGYGAPTSTSTSIEIADQSSSVSLGVNVDSIAGGNFRGNRELIIPNDWQITQVNAAGTDFIMPVLSIINGSVNPNLTYRHNTCNTGKAAAANTWTIYPFQIDLPATPNGATATWVLVWTAHFQDNSATAGYLVQTNAWSYNGSAIVAEYGSRQLSYMGAAGGYGSQTGFGLVQISAATSFVLASYPNQAIVESPPVGGAFSRLLAVRIA